jgi:hypothetical protein
MATALTKDIKKLVPRTDENQFISPRPDKRNGVTNVMKDVSPLIPNIIRVHLASVQNHVKVRSFTPFCIARKKSSGTQPIEDHS